MVVGVKGRIAGGNLTAVGLIQGHESGANRF